MTAVDTDDLPALHGFVHGLRMDLPAVVAGLTLPYGNGPMEGANTKVKLLNGRCTAGLVRPPTTAHPARIDRSPRPPFLRQSRSFYSPDGGSERG
jgi:hypothetical protein